MAMADAHYNRVRRHFDAQYSMLQGRPSPAGVTGAAIGCLRDSELVGNALEIGCGGGANMRVLAESGMFRSVHGIDLSGTGISRALAHLGPDGMRHDVLLHQGNVVRYTGAAEPYSLILINSVFEYMLDQDKQRLVFRMMRSTAPGGLNAIGMVTSLPHDFIEQRLGYPDMDTGHGRPMFSHGSAEVRRLDFESGLADMYRDAGWDVRVRTRYEAERNFVQVGAEMLIAQKRL